MIRILSALVFCTLSLGFTGQITLPLDSLPSRILPPPSFAIHYLPEAPVVGAAPHGPTSALDAPHAVTALLAGEIQQAGTPALAPALETLPGVDIRTRGPLGVQADLGIRGGTFEQAALYVDGIRWSAPQTAHHLLNLPFDPTFLSSVEVVRGGTSAFGGVGAFAGSVHLALAHDPLNPFVQASLEGGAYGWKRAALAASWGTSALHQRASVSHSRTDGYSENTDALVTRATWIGDWTGRVDGRWRALVGMEEKSFGAQSFYSAAYPHQFEATGSTVGQVTWRRFRKWNSLAGAYARLHRDRFELYRIGPAWYQAGADGRYVRAGMAGVPADTAAAWYAGPNRHRSLTAGLTGRTSLHHHRHRLTLGADARFEAVRSNVLGVLVDSTAVLSKGAERFNVDAFVSERLATASDNAAMTVTLGLNANSRFGVRLLPALNGRLRLGSGRSRGENWEPWTVFASAGRSIRHPSYTDLYYQGGARGRADLQPELADQVELGVRWQQRKVWHPQLGGAAPLHRLGADAAIWLRRGTDLIDWILQPESAEFEAANLTETLHRGVEVAGFFQTEGMSTQRLRHLRVSFTATDASTESVEFTSSYALDVIGNKADLMTTWLLPKQVLLEVRATRQDRLGTYRDAAGGEVEYAPFTWVGAGLSRGFLAGRLRIFTRVDNIFDAEFVDFGSVVQPGRWWRAGVTWKAKPE